MTNKLNIYELQSVRDAINDVVGFLTDNSCGDPECCGDPYYTQEDYDTGVKILKGYGILVDDKIPSEF